MKIIGSVLREQGVEFAVALVKQRVIQNSTEAAQTMRGLGACFPRLPVVLAAQDSSGRFTYYGRRDISRFLASIDPRRIPWREYTLSEA